MPKENQVLQQLPFGARKANSTKNKKKQIGGLKYILKLASIKTTAYMKIQLNYSVV